MFIVFGLIGWIILFGRNLPSKFTLVVYMSPLQELMHRRAVERGESEPR